MEYRNLLNFIFSLLLIFSLIAFVPFVNSVVTALAVTYFVINLAEWLMETTRKYIMHRQVSPRNKVVLITGCDTGFGNLLARRMDTLGYSVLATCLNPDGEGARKLSEDCSKKLIVLPMDVTDEQSIQKVKTFVEKNLELNVLWAVVNNAGILHCGLADWTSVDEFQRICNVNTFGTLRVTKAFLPFVKQSKGRIVNVTSYAAHSVIPGSLPYSLSKSSAVALTSGLQMELSMWDVKCISIKPYVYATSIIDRQALIAMTRKTWNAAPDDIREEYGEDFFKAFKTEFYKLLSLVTNSNISEVIDCLEDAITAEDPLPVYIPANLLHRILMLLYQTLPLGMKEFLGRCLIEYLCGKPLTLKMKGEKKNSYLTF